jgi:hypothetical protein
MNPRRERDAKVCSQCGEELRDGELVMRSMRAINKRPPFKYRCRVEHMVCPEPKVKD